MLRNNLFKGGTIGLAQKISFEYNRAELEKLLNAYGFIYSEGKFIYSNGKTEVEVFIEDFGIYIHRSGEYFELLGTLVEGLGNITEKITIEDN